MEDSLAGKLFINSEQVGDFVTVTMPGRDGVEDEDIRIHYLEAGVGEPLLLIHGIGQSLYTWRRVFPELSENYRVLALDLPGHGYSSRPERFAYSMDEMAHLLRGFLDAKEIKRAHMIGFSTGAMYMLRLLTLFPESAANCIAISPGGITKQMPGLIRSLRSPFKAVFTRNLFSAGDVKRLLAECVYDQTAVDDRVVKQYYEPVSDGLSREALMYAVRNFDLKYVTDGLRQTDHEVLLLWGREDRWHTVNNSVFFQGVLQNGRYFLIRNAGHIVQEDAPGKLLEVIMSYISPAVPVYRAPRRKTNGKQRAETVPAQDIAPESEPAPVHQPVMRRAQRRRQETAPAETPTETETVRTAQDEAVFEETLETTAAAAEEAGTADADATTAETFEAMQEDADEVVLPPEQAEIPAEAGRRKARRRTEKA